MITINLKSKPRPMLGEEHVMVNAEPNVMSYADMLALGAGDGVSLKHLFPQSHQVGGAGCEWLWIKSHCWNLIATSPRLLFFHCHKCDQYGVQLRSKNS